MIKRHHPTDRRERQLLKEKHNATLKEDRSSSVWKRLHREALKVQETEDELRESSLGTVG